MALHQAIVIINNENQYQLGGERGVFSMTGKQARKGSSKWILLSVVILALG
jgi:hypothetical protein